MNETVSWNFFLSLIWLFSEAEKPSMVLMSVITRKNLFNI